jgi:hypothetical protein
MSDEGSWALEAASSANMGLCERWYTAAEVDSGIWVATCWDTGGNTGACMGMG